MSETTTPSEGTTPTTPASEPATTPTGAGGGNEGSGGGSQTDAGALAAERDAAVQRARDEQARADRLQAELAAREPAKPAATATPAPLTMEGLTAELNRRDEIAGASAALRTEFPDADPSVFTATAYANAEQLRAAVEDSDRATKASKQALRAEVDAEVRARYAEQYGPLNETTPPDAGGGTTGDPTPEQLRGMSLDEMDALEAKSPGAINRILRSA